MIPIVVFHEQPTPIYKLCQTHIWANETIHLPEIRLFWDIYRYHCFALILGGSSHLLSRLYPRCKWDK